MALYIAPSGELTLEEITNFLQDRHTDPIMKITHSLDRTSRVEISRSREKSLRTVHQ